jgi:hypothetical protein
VTLSFERTPDGRRLCVSGTVSGPRDAAWDVLTDTDCWPLWGPSVTGVDASQRYVEAGLTGHVRTVLGLRVPFEITTCRDYRWSWRVAGVPATGHRVEGDGHAPCRVVFEVPPAAGPYVVVCGVAIRRIAELVERRR